MLLSIATALGMAGVIFSLLFAAWQTRELARQTKINTKVAAANQVRESIVMLHHVSQLVVERPELLRYLYGGERPQPGTPTGDTVVVIVEMFGDSLAAALETSEQLADPRNSQAWRDYSRYVLEGCPTLVERVVAYPTWWPALTDLIRAEPITPRPATATTATTATIPGPVPPPMTEAVPDLA